MPPDPAQDFAGHCLLFLDLVLRLHSVQELEPGPVLVKELELVL